VQFGELIDASDDRLPKEICDAVARAIHARTRDFFASTLDGVETWSLRAAQDLFGEARPAPEVFWPLDRPAKIGSPTAAAATDVVPRAQIQRRRALAASISAGLILPAAVAMGVAIFNDASAPLADSTQVVSASSGLKAPAPPVEAMAGLLSVSSISGPESRLAMDIALRPDVAPLPRAAIYPSRFVLIDQTTRLDPGPKFPNFAEIAALWPNAEFPAGDIATAHARHRAQSAARKSDAPTGVAAMLVPEPRVSRNVEPTLGRRAVMAISGVFRGIKRIPMQLAQLVKPQPAQR